MQYLMPTNQVSAYSVSVVIGSVINALLNVPLILTLGTIGAIIATVLSELSVSCYQLFAIRTQLRLSRLFSESWKYLVAGLLMYLVAKAITLGLPDRVWAIGVEVLVGTVVYLLVLLLFQPKVLFGYINHFLNRVRR